MRYNYQYNFNSKKVHIGAQLNSLPSEDSITFEGDTEPLTFEGDTENITFELIEN